MRSAHTGLVVLIACTLAACSSESPSTTAPPEQSVESASQEPNPAAVAVSRNPLRNPYFGDVHVHTGNSFDAFVFGVKRTPEDAYRFARGEAIPQDAGFDIQLQGPPLDFLAVTDHGEYLGVVRAMADPGNPLSSTDTAATAFGGDRLKAVETFQKIGLSFVQSNPIEEIFDRGYMDSVWAQTVEAAERFNEPGVFTAFAGYEFTAMRMVEDAATTGALNLHRNVLFRGSAPDRLFTTLDSPNPEQLWRWMSQQRAVGHEVLSIPHNSNASNGEMFASVAYDGSDLTAELITLRAANEPLVEISQIKGTSETHPNLSPNDEWANFELYNVLIGSTEPSVVDAGSFVRPSLARGIDIEDKLGNNPFQSGFIASSDTHVAAGTFLEEKHWGKFPADGVPEGRNSIPPHGADGWAEQGAADDPLSGATASHYSASGLAGVWAEANTREDIFDAMRRRETFGTSGPRMTVRLFAGDYQSGILSAANMIKQAYQNGHPMGSAIDAGAAAPVFLALGAQDPRSHPLQRMQIIKVWNEAGAPREAVFDIACSGGAQPDASTHRCPDNGATVDLNTCETQPGSGSSTLQALWQDPTYVASLPAAYYVRVLENASCRWSTWDAIRNGTAPNPELPLTLQERAWSSPIWIN